MFQAGLQPSFIITNRFQPFRPAAVSTASSTKRMGDCPNQGCEKGIPALTDAYIRGILKQRAGSCLIQLNALVIGV